MLICTHEQMFDCVMLDRGVRLGLETCSVIAAGVGGNGNA